MNILQISKFYPPVMGGIESVAFELTEGMNRLGLKTDVLCAHTGGRTRHDFGPGGYRITRAGSLATVLSTSISPALVMHARRLAPRYDVIHVQMPDPMAALALWVARPRAKLVVHWQSDVVNQQRALKLYEPLQTWLLARADAIVATTPPYAASSPWLRRWKDKVRIIPNGITEAKPSDCSVKARQLRERYAGKRIVFSLGRMTYYKGFGVLIDAAARLPSDSVVVVGGGGELLEEYRRQVAQRRLSERIVFVGRVADEDIPSYYEAASIFCLPSIVRAEAYGVVLLEAMAMGRPIVATDIPGSGVPWVNQHRTTGLNVPVGDPTALAEALRQLLDNEPLARQFGEAGRVRFLRFFTSETMVSETVKLYRDLLGTAL
jgi:glycosyltransferase involved in cell wall biosynthesis